MQLQKLYNFWQIRAVEGGASCRNPQATYALPGKQPHGRNSNSFSRTSAPPLKAHPPRRPLARRQFIQSRESVQKAQEDATRDAASAHRNSGRVPTISTNPSGGKPYDRPYPTEAPLLKRSKIQAFVGVNPESGTSSFICPASGCHNVFSTHADLRGKFPLPRNSYPIAKRINIIILT